jgi:hypothetical protein
MAISPDLIENAKKKIARRKHTHELLEQAKKGTPSADVPALA